MGNMFSNDKTASKNIKANVNQLFRGNSNTESFDLTSSYSEINSDTLPINEMDHQTDLETIRETKIQAGSSSHDSIVESEMERINQVIKGGFRKQTGGNDTEYSEFERIKEMLLKNANNLEGGFEEVSDSVSVTDVSFDDSTSINDSTSNSNSTSINESTNNSSSTYTESGIKIMPFYNTTESNVSTPYIPSRFR